MTAKKPTYIGTLNAIVNGERQGFELLDCWSTVCDPEIQSMLKTVALREGEHAATFEKRLCELGFTLKEKRAEGFDKTLQMIASDMSDMAKFEQLGYDKLGEGDGEDQLLKLLADKTIAPATAGLLGRFIAEERDSLLLLKAAYECTRAKGEPESPVASDDLLTQVCQQLSELSDEVAKLREKVEGKSTKSRKSKVRAVK